MNLDYASSLAGFMVISTGSCLNILQDVLSKISCSLVGKTECNKVASAAIDFVLPEYSALVNWVSIGSGNGFMPIGAKPIPEPMLTYRQFDP